MQALMRLCARNPILRKLLNSTVLRVTRQVEWQRKIFEYQPSFSPDICLNFINEHLPDLAVRHGPFNGLKYPRAISICSTIVPKLLGTYESELHEVFGSLLAAQKFDTILDIGCAEGYYAVGLAVKQTGAKVFAVDIDAEACDLCREMAIKNGVSDRVDVWVSCTPEDLIRIDVNGNCLVISDCEGFELDLLTVEVVQHLKNAWLIIETHDFLNPYISSILEERLKATHSLRRISSVDDLKKARTYVVPELDQLDLNARKKLLAECRPAEMDWLIATPITGNE